MDISASRHRVMTTQATADIDVSRPGLDFDTFCRQHSEAVARALIVTLNDPALAVDATNEALIRAYQRWPKIATRDNPAAWVYRVALERARSRNQGQQRRDRPIVVTKTRVAAADDADRDERLTAALRDLSVDDRTVLVCRIHLDWSADRTAQVMGITPETVMSRLSHAMTPLRQVVEQANEQETGDEDADTDNDADLEMVDGAADTGADHEKRQRASEPIPVDDPLREFFDETAAAVVVADLLESSAIGTLAKRRDRKRRVVGGLLTVSLVALLTVAVGLSGRVEQSNAVFAGTSGSSTTPSMMVRHNDMFVGVGAVDASEVQEEEIARSVVVTSTDGRRWDVLDDGPTVVAGSVVLGEYDGIVHVIGIGHTSTEDAAAIDDASSGATVVHYRSADLATWTERSYPVPADLLLDGQRLIAVDVGFVDEVAVVMARQAPTDEDVRRSIQALGVDDESTCEMIDSGNRTTIRLCGTAERIDIPRATARPQIFTTVLFGIDPDGVFGIDLPEVDNVTLLVFGPWSSLYQTDDGVGFAQRRNFETTDGRVWKQRDLGGPIGGMVAVRGAEQVYKTPYHVARYGPGDPVKGMGFSPDGGATWIDIQLEDLFGARETVPRIYSDLTVGEAGWAVLTSRSLAVPAEVPGVELDEDDSSFTLEADGFVLAGRTPFGPAVLSDSTGRAVRTWSQLEVGDPAWSGLEMFNGDVVAVDELTGREFVTFSSEQWSALNPHGGANTFDLLYSRDGLEWTVIDTASSRTRILAITADEILVQRLPVAPFSSVHPPVEVIRLPTRQDAPNAD